MSLKSLFNAAAADKTLYNVTFDLRDDSLILHPNVPYSVAKGCGEDSETQRVCLSDSIELCLSAIGPGFRDLRVGGELVVRSVPMSELDPAALVSYLELYDSGKVPDAMENHEFWYLKDVKVNRAIYRIMHFTYEHTIAYTCLKADDVLRIARKYISIIPSAYVVNAKELCSYISKILLDSKRFEELDEFDEAIAELPWAQKISIRNLVLKQVNE